MSLRNECVTQGLAAVVVSRNKLHIPPRRIPRHSMTRRKKEITLNHDPHAFTYGTRASACEYFSNCCIWIRDRAERNGFPVNAHAGTDIWLPSRVRSGCRALCNGEVGWLIS